ncbi:ATP-binding cassette domain-containing protein [Luteimonas sp. SJ-92]|uniref:ATP-binding cassette domain-containing protein n=2 Tax=Luteimonas salinisoli TaxID=2752307 RepID=A0A853J9P7_9GAMM|nr:ABC transporter transmembrane domain-containing protein [Luteimonas salinisoli]NZA25407.1 ATP-binding cassette domain-containing protein [Luteimonas salinisoli]
MDNPHLQRLAILKPFAGRLAFGLFFMVLTVSAQLAYPKVLSSFIDNIAAGKSGDWYSTLAVIMLCVLVVHAIATALRYYLLESTGHMIVTRIRRLLFAALINQGVPFYDKHNVGELTNRLSSDVEILHGTLTMGAAISLRSFCVLAGGGVMMLYTSPALSLILAVFMPVGIYLGKRAGKSYRVRAKEVQDGLADCGKVAYEHFSNIRLVHAFNQQRVAKKRYADATGNALSVLVSSTRLIAVFRGMISFLTYLALLVTLWWGARLISDEQLTIGELAAFLLYAVMVTESANAISDFWTSWMRTIGATERIFEIIQAGTHGEWNASQVAKLTGSVEFSRLVFAYPERPDTPALKGISFSIVAGEKVALVGASGAGKSTVANMILGFYAPDEGRILFDGVDARYLDVQDIRESIAIVEQEPSLFSGSIFENIAFAVSERDVGLAEVRNAARLANAHEFISRFKDGYETIVGERGVQLSGGQKQRIAIARALLRDPRILILDEATSALDSASEQQVQEALKLLMRGRTTIIIAHRYSTITNADRVLVMNHGRLVQEGRHADLINDREGLYFSLMHNQLRQHGSVV